MEKIFVKTEKLCFFSSQYKRALYYAFSQSLKYSNYKREKDFSDKFSLDAEFLLYGLLKLKNTLTSKIFFRLCSLTKANQKEILYKLKLRLRYKNLLKQKKNILREKKIIWMQKKQMPKYVIWITPSKSMIKEEFKENNSELVSKFQLENEITKNSQSIIYSSILNRKTSVVTTNDLLSSLLESPQTKALLARFISNTKYIYKLK